MAANTTREQVDCLEHAEALRDTIIAWRTAPKRTVKDRSQFDAWRLAISPQIPLLIRWSSALAKPENWEFGEDDVADYPRPTKWHGWSVNEIGRLFVGLTRVARVVESVRFKVGTNFTASTISGEGVEPALTRGREVPTAAELKGLGYPAFKRYRAAQVKGLLRCRKQLMTLVARMQTAEERRLQARVAKLALHSNSRARGKELLKEMRASRIQLKKFNEERPAAYGQQLRGKWVYPRRRMITLLEGSS